METFQIIVLPIIFISTFTRSTVGFGDAMIAMPLLAMAVGINVATPLVGLIAVTISITILVKQWRNVHFKSVSMLIISTLLGIPVGILLLKGICNDVMKLILAIVIIVFSLYKILKPKLFTLANDKFAYIFGLLAGILGGAYNTNGPPVVIYGSLRQWNPAKFRATLQGYFLPTGAMIAFGHGAGGLWTQQVLANYLLCLPVVFMAIILGGIVNAKIPKGKFDNVVHVCLIVIGITLLINTGMSLGRDMRQLISPVQTTSTAMYLENVHIITRRDQHLRILTEQVAGADSLCVTTQLTQCIAKPIERERQ